MTLKTYKSKRHFKDTPEPSGVKKTKTSSNLIFVIQKHAASHLHYDLRLEANGVLVSWAVPKQPSLDPNVKRLAIHVEDHPIEYATFAGIIPKGNYGAGTVEIWDHGTYNLAHDEKDFQSQLKKGELRFTLYGEKLSGDFALVRMSKDPDNKQWLFFKINENIKAKSKPKKNTSTPMPHHVKPMLATLTEEPFNKKNWLYEIKWDGYRAIAEIEDGNIQLYSRNLLSFEKQFPTIYRELKQLKKNAILDGEIVVLDREGIPQFQLLQNYLNSGEAGGSLNYIVFDILYCDEQDLRSLPLIQRKAILEEYIGKGTSHIRYSDYIEEQGVALFREAKKRNLEGIIAKDSNSTYISKRSKSWLKIKTQLRQEVVVVGFTDPKGSRKWFGSLILGIYNDAGELVYAGHSGGGFNQKSLKEIYQQLEPLQTEQCPFKKVPREARKSHWVKPKLVCEVSFTEWTKEGYLRHPVFQGMRIDKSPKDVHREK